MTDSPKKKKTRKKKKKKKPNKQTKKKTFEHKYITVSALKSKSGEFKKQFKNER